MNKFNNYLTTSTGASTYQTIANMSNYITSSSLTTTLGSYLTTSTASSTYAPKAGPTFTGTLSAATINASTDIQVAGTSISTTYAKNRVNLFFAGTGGSVSNSGQYTATVNRTSTGIYSIGWGTTISGNYSPMVLAQSTSTSVNYNANLTTINTTGCTIAVKDSSNAFQDAACWVCVF